MTVSDLDRAKPRCAQNCACLQVQWQIAIHLPCPSSFWRGSSSPVPVIKDPPSPTQLGVQSPAESISTSTAVFHLLSLDAFNPGAKDVVDLPPPALQMVVPPQIPPPAAQPMEELIQQSQWNLQQQEQHLHTLRQEQMSAAIALAMEQQNQKLLVETQLDITELDNLLQPIIDTCTKDAISAGKNWMFNNAKTPQHCELMASHLCNRITADSAHFELRLHLIYLTNDVLHHCQRKQQKDLLAALQKVVVPIYCTSFLAVEEEKQQKITRVSSSSEDLSLRLFL
uniref:CID domain-containing protein n=1 Tax=Oryzias sinensis TaxID=183150 RepID=A0A8C7Y3L7_9TELE